MLVVSGLLVQSVPGFARDKVSDARPEQLVPGDETGAPDEPKLSQQQAAGRAQRQFGGRVLSIRPYGPGYSVKLLKDGEVRTVFISP
ncbi:MAG TPA: PepSY domain-containing protein [Solimonas sp.]|nr:PepSY domain-containing protein [Solimonas sp.]